MKKVCIRTWIAGRPDIPSHHPFSEMIFAILYGDREIGGALKERQNFCNVGYEGAFGYLEVTHTKKMECEK